MRFTPFMLFVFVLCLASGCRPEDKSKSTQTTSTNEKTNQEEPKVFFPPIEAKNLMIKNLASAQAKYTGNRYRLRGKQWGVRPDIFTPDKKAAIVVIPDLDDPPDIDIILIADMSKESSRIFDNGFETKKKRVFDITITSIETRSRRLYVFADFNQVLKD